MSQASEKYDSISFLDELYSTLDVASTTEVVTIPLADFNWQGELPSTKKIRPNPRAKLSPEEKEEREQKRLADQRQRLLEQQERAAQRHIANEKAKQEREELFQIRKEMCELTERANRMKRDSVALSKYKDEIIPRVVMLRKKVSLLVELTEKLNEKIAASGLVALQDFRPSSPITITL